jgi:hypothetical protein
LSHLDETLNSSETLLPYALSGGANLSRLHPELPVGRMKEPHALILSR